MINEILIETKPTITNYLVGYPYIITTISKDGIPDASTLSYVTAIHWNPPSIIMSLDSKHKTTTNLFETKKFTLSVLRRNETNKEIASEIGTTSGNKIKKFDDLYSLEKNNIDNHSYWPPIVRGSILALHGEIIKNLRYHGQILFIGEVRSAKIIDLLQHFTLKDRKSLWQALDEMVLSHSDLYSSI